MRRAHTSGIGDNGGRYAGAALGRGKVCTKAHYLGLRREKRAQGVGVQVYWVCVFVLDISGVICCGGGGSAGR